MTQFAFGHAVRMRPDGSILYRFQNFFVGKQITHSGRKYEFAPFGFSGVTVNRTGDGLEATLVFPNNNITRKWAIEAIEKNWVMEVDVLIIEDTDVETGLTATHTIAHTYTGQVTGGNWDNVSVSMELGSVLDAVGTDIPRRSLSQRMIGNLPVSNNVRLQ